MEMHRSCPVCGSLVSRKLFAKGKLILVQCSACSMVYADSISSEVATGSLYESLSAPYYLSPEKLQGDYSPVRFVRELKLFRKFCRSGRVLDVGCSTGAFLYSLKHRYPSDYEVVGNDIAGPALDYAESKGISVLKQPFLDFEPAGEVFDAVTFWAVMEHLPDPNRFLEHAMRLLRPGGHCFVLVPNFQSLAVKVLGPKYRYILDQHVNYFTLGTLKAMALKVPEAKIVASGFSHFNPVVIWQDMKGDGTPVPDHARAQLLQKTNRLKGNRLFGPLKHMLGAVERALNLLHLSDNTFLVIQKVTG